MSKGVKLAMTAGLFEGTYKDPSMVDLNSLDFKYSSAVLANTNPPVKRHEWKVNVRQPGKVDGEFEQKSLDFCLTEPVAVAGFSFKSKDMTLVTRIEDDKLLADRIEKGEKVNEKDDEDVAVTVACFLDLEKPSHKAFVDFGTAIVSHLKEFIKKNPEKGLGLKASEIDIQNPVRVSKAGRHYFVLRLSTTRRIKDKSFSSTGFFLNGQLRPMPWSHLARSQFQGFFFFRIASFGMTKKEATPVLYANSCRKVENVVPLISSAERAAIRQMSLLGETYEPAAALIDAPPAEDEDDQASVEPTGDVIRLDE